MGREIWSDRHITFIVAEKAQFTVLFAIFSVYEYVEGGGWLKTSGGEGVGRKRQNTDIWGERGLKLLKKLSYI